jgi:hypothetical protein
MGYFFFQSFKSGPLYAITIIEGFACSQIYQIADRRLERQQIR